MNDIQAAVRRIIARADYDRYRGVSLTEGELRFRAEKLRRKGNIR